MTLRNGELFSSQFNEAASIYRERRISEFESQFAFELSGGAGFDYDCGANNCGNNYNGNTDVPTMDGLNWPIETDHDEKSGQFAAMVEFANVIQCVVGVGLGLFIIGLACGFSFLFRVFR